MPVHVHDWRRCLVAYRLNDRTVSHGAVRVLPSSA